MGSVTCRLNFTDFLDPVAHIRYPSKDTENEEHELAEGFDIPAAMMRTMTTGDMYFNTLSPEKQFVGALVEKKASLI